MSDDAPDSYKDPYWAQLASAAEQKAGLPAGLLQSIVTNGEKSNNSAVSEAGAKTPFQITPATRNLILKRDGIDAYLNPQNAADAAALVAKDGVNWAQARTQDPDAVNRLAAGYYHAGGDTSNWGPKTNAYIARVSGGQAPIRDDTLDNDFAKWVATNRTPVPQVSSAPVQGNTSLDDAMAQFMANGGKPHVVGTNDIVPLGPGESHPQTVTPEPTIPQKMVGAGEAALALGTGLVGSTVGALAGGLGAIGSGVAGALQGRDPGPNSIEQGMDAGARALTYQPRTQSGQDQAGALGDVMQNIPAIAALPETGAILHAATPIIRSGIGTAADAATSLPGAVKGGITSLANRVRGTMPPEVTAGVENASAAAPVIPAEPVAGAAAEAAPSVPEVAQAARQAAGGAPAAVDQLAGMASPDPETIAAADRLGIGDHLQSDHVTTNDGYRQVVGVLKSNPTSALAQGEKLGLAAVAKRGSDLIDQIGNGATDLSGVDANLKAATTATHAEITAREDALYQKIRDTVPAQTPAPATNALDFLAQRAKDVGGIENLTPMEKTLAAKLSPKGGADAALLDALSPTARAQAIAQGAVGTKQPTYALLDDVRRGIGAKSSQDGPFSDAGTGLAKKYYGLLSQDQGKVADAAGAGDLWATAKAATTTRKGMEDDLASLFGKNLDGSVVPQLGTAMKSAAAGDASKLVGILKATPDNLKQQVTAAGFQTVMRNAATRGDMSFTGFAKWMNSLKGNKQAFAAVMSNLPPEARQQIMDLARVSQGISDSLGARIKTGLRSSVLTEMEAGDTLATKLQGLAKHALKGLAVDLVGGHGAGVTAAVMSAFVKKKTPAMQAVDALLVSPQFEAAVRKVGTPGQAAAITSLANKSAFQKLAKSDPSLKTQAARERWISLALQAAPAAGVASPGMRPAPRPLMAPAPRPTAIH